MKLYNVVTIGFFADGRFDVIATIYRVTDEETLKRIASRSGDELVKLRGFQKVSISIFPINQDDLDAFHGVKPEKPFDLGQWYASKQRQIEARRHLGSVLSDREDNDGRV